MVKFLSLILILNFSLAYANSSQNIIVINEDELLSKVDELIPLDSTCIDEYLLRQKQIRRFLIWAPPATLISTPIGAYAGGALAAFISSTLLKQGWAALGWTILGALGSGSAVLVTGTSMSISRGVEYRNNSFMLELIAASHAQELQNKRLNRLVRRYNRRYDHNTKNVDEVAAIIQDLDISGALCSGEVRGIINPKNLKYSLAKRRHLMRFISNHY